MKKKAYIFALAMLLVIVACTFIFATKYFSYRNAITNSNFLMWCNKVSTNDLELAEIYCGYGQQKVAYKLTDKDITELINVLNKISAKELSLKNPNADSNEDGINLYLRCQDDIEYLFRYAPTTSDEISVATTVANHDEFGNRNGMYVENDLLNSFISSRDPRKQ